MDDDPHKLEPERNYAKIIQSSGTYVFTGRPWKKIICRAYPLTNASVRKHFRHASATTEELECKQYLRKFLSSLFVSARLLILDFFPGNKTKKIQAHGRNLLQLL